MGTIANTNKHDERMRVITYRLRNIPILVIEQNYKTLELVVDQFIIRCNYANKFSYWKRESNLKKKQTHESN